MAIRPYRQDNLNSDMFNYLFDRFSQCLSQG